MSDVRALTFLPVEQDREGAAWVKAFDLLWGLRKELGYEGPHPVLDEEERLLTSKMLARFGHWSLARIRRAAEVLNKRYRRTKIRPFMTQLLHHVMYLLACPEGPQMVLEGELLLLKCYLNSLTEYSTGVMGWHAMVYEDYYDSDGNLETRTYPNPEPCPYG